jgi:hypothetical protein
MGTVTGEERRRRMEELANQRMTLMDTRGQDYIVEHRDRLPPPRSLAPRWLTLSQV